MARDKKAEKTAAGESGAEKKPAPSRPAPNKAPARTTPVRGPGKKSAAVGRAAPVAVSANAAAPASAPAAAPIKKSGKSSTARAAVAERQTAVAGAPDAGGKPARAKTAKPRKAAGEQSAPAPETAAPKARATKSTADGAKKPRGAGKARNSSADAKARRTGGADTSAGGASVDNSEHNFEPRDFAAALMHYVRPDSLKREGSRLLAEARRILAGESELDVGRDRRFSDAAWRDNAFYRRLGQGYLAFCQALEGMVEQDKADPLRYEKAKLLVDHITSLASPTNALLGNPAALKKAYETRGRSLLSGARNFVDDLVNNRGMPSQVDDSGFIVGEDLAVSEGAVVFRNGILELLQYKPTTAQVHDIPLLVITPQINKFYFLDLAPGRSFVEYMTAQGYQVFIISWRNPGPEHGDWRLEAYCSALVEALDAMAEITGCPQVNTFGFCAGGITMSSLVGYLTAIGQGQRINTVNYAVTLLDFSHPALISVMKSNFLLKFAKGSSRVSGVLDGGNLATMFTMLRPRDLIWDNWVNNYLMGNPSPVFDILAWNKDCTNLPAALHEDYLNIFNHNLLATPGALTIHGEAIDLGSITQDAFVVGTVNDHLTPWQGCYGTTQLLGGKAEFVLSSAGHVAGLVNPPGNPKSFYMTGPQPGPDPEAWEAQAERHAGSWWEYWATWAASRSGRQKRARKTLGSRKHPVLAKAPGTYVFEQP